MGGAVEVDGGDDAADDGAVSSSTGQSALSDPVAGVAVPAGSGEGGGVEPLGGEGAVESTFGFSLMCPPEVRAKQDRDHPRIKQVYPSANGSHDCGQIRAIGSDWARGFAELTLSVATDTVAPTSLGDVHYARYRAASGDGSSPQGACNGHVHGHGTTPCLSICERRITDL